MDTYLQRTIEFLNEIGIPTYVVEGASGFIEHCVIESGTLMVDPRCPASGLLHEAGHLAVVPSQYRSLFSGDVGRGQRAMLDAISALNLHPDAPLYRAAIQACEAEATAWAYAAGTYLRIPFELIYQDHEYQNGGAILRFQLSHNSHFGVHGLQHAGFCKVRASGVGDKPVFPRLAFWLQPEISPDAEIRYG